MSETPVWFRVMLKHLLRAFTGGGTLEDRLSHLLRAVEGACVGLQLNRGRPLEVEESVRGEVEMAIDELIDGLGEIGGRASDDDRARIAQLQNRVREIAANGPSFPTQLLALVEAVGLPDAEWLNDFTFRLKNPRPDERPRTPTSWAGAAAYVPQPYLPLRVHRLRHLRRRQRLRVHRPSLGCPRTSRLSSRRLLRPIQAALRKRRNAHLRDSELGDTGPPLGRGLPLHHVTTTRAAGSSQVGSSR